MALGLGKYLGYAKIYWLYIVDNKKASLGRLVLSYRSSVLELSVSLGLIMSSLSNSNSISALHN